MYITGLKLPCLSSAKTIYKYHEEEATSVYSYVWLNHAMSSRPQIIPIFGYQWITVCERSDIQYKPQSTYTCINLPAPTTTTTQLSDRPASIWCAYFLTRFPCSEMLMLMTSTNERGGRETEAHYETARFSHSDNDERLGETVQPASILYHSFIIRNIQIVMVQCLIKHTGFLVYRWK